MVKLVPALLVASALAVALAACGNDDGKLEPKRTIDARNEAVRYFPRETPFVALVDPTPTDDSDPAEVIAQIAAVPAVGAFAGNDIGFAGRQGLTASQLSPFLDTQDPTLGAESTQIAVGVTPTGTPTEDSLIVVVTDDPERTDGLIADGAPAAGLDPAGKLDGADLYKGDEAALSVRDGVILLAGTIDEVKSAIRTRDSESDIQLDDGLVDDTLDDLPQDAALRAFVDIGALARSDPGISALASGSTGWIQALGAAGVSIDPGENGGPADISMVAKIDNGDRSLIPIEERPQRVELDAADLNQASAGEFAPTSGFHDALVHLAPAVLSVSATDDELRALLVSDR